MLPQTLIITIVNIIISSIINVIAIIIIIDKIIIIFIYVVIVTNFITCMKLLINMILDLSHNSNFLSKKHFIILGKKPRMAPGSI